MTKAEVKALVGAAKTVAGIRGALSVNPYGVHVRWEDMPRENVTFEPRGVGDAWPWRASTEVDGVTFFALLTQEEYDALQGVAK